MLRTAVLTSLPTSVGTATGTRFPMALAAGLLILFTATTAVAETRGSENAWPQAVGWTRSATGTTAHAALSPSTVAAPTLRAHPESPSDTVQRRGMVPEDYYRVVQVGDPQISPDGSAVAFTVRRTSDDRRSREGGIWMVPADGSAPPRPFTTGTGDRSPRWSPDGRRLAFLRSAEGTGQIHLIHLDGGEAEAVTSLRQGSISDFQWFPDGEGILVTLSLEPGAKTPTDQALRQEGPTPDVTVIRNAVYKADGTGYMDGRRLRIWTLHLGSGELRPLTSGDSLWNDRNAHLSPHGLRIAFDRDASGQEYDGSPNRDLFTVEVGGGEPVAIPQPEGRAEAPLWSPDGSRLAYRYTPEPYARTHIHLTDLTDADPSVPTLEVDLVPSGLTWHPGGSHLLFTADRQGSRPLLRLEADGSGYRPILGEQGSVAGFSLSEDGSRIAFLLEDEATPPEVWVAEADGSLARQLTRFNEELLEQLAMGRLQEFRFRNGAGGETHGFFLEPVGRAQGERYPLVLNIKGGPGGMWGRQWFHEFQMLAAAGYAVAFVNYRGSSGYGHAHSSAVRLDYGGADAQDNLQAVDEVLRRWDWVDPDRLFVTGGSHGGFLTNWLTTQTNRFRAAVTQRSVSNWISEAGTQAYPPRSMREEFGGTIWGNHQYYWERSPLAHAHRVTTPTLVIHSDRDMITPLGQGEEWFYALKALGVPTEMVVFRGESHGLSRTGTPVNLVERLRRILEWFHRWDDPTPRWRADPVESG
jgi:dipeptidyl aminopeptidase/acylaminoacyl peptidase